jgi:hypothetical protein
VSFLEKNPDFAAVRTNGLIVNENNLEDTSKLFVTDEGEKKKQIFLKICSMVKQTIGG